MPVVKVEYDDSVVNEAEARAVCEATQAVVIAATGIKETFVYGNSAHIKLDIAPIEIFIEMSDHKVADEVTLTKDLKDKLSEWKKNQSYPHPINLTLIPMHWNIEINI